MNPQDLQMGDLIDLKITRLPESTFIVGEIVGLRRDYFQPDSIAVLIGGIDIWITLTDDMVVRLADV
jgi:hypothetical protein